jgi:hypothetical protein
MGRSVKRLGQPEWSEWFEFAQVEDGKKASSLRDESTNNNIKKSVHLGQRMAEPDPVSVLPLKLSLTGLLEYHDCAIAKHLLNTNTFFHGKVGFYEIIMRKIYSVMGEKTHEINYLHTIQNLPKENKLPQLPLLPNVKSEEALNDFVAQSLRHKSKAPVWLVANPLSVYKHLLLGFHNFFIASNNPDEIKYLQDVFSLPKVMVDLLLSNERESIFITDFEPVVNKAYLPIAIVRLERLD